MAVKSPYDKPLGEEPELQQLAEFLNTADGMCWHSSAGAVARWLIARTPSTRRQLAALEQWARDAGLGFERGAAYEAFLLHRDVQRLLSCDDWEWPEEVLDPKGEQGVDLGELLGLCRAIAERGEGNAAQLAQVERRLLRAVDRRSRLIAARQRAQTCDAGAETARG